MHNISSFIHSLLIYSVIFSKSLYPVQGHWSLSGAHHGNTAHCTPPKCTTVPLKHGGTGTAKIGPGVMTWTPCICIFSVNNQYMHLFRTFCNATSGCSHDIQDDFKMNLKGERCWISTLAASLNHTQWVLLCAGTYCSLETCPWNLNSQWYIIPYRSCSVYTHTSQRAD